MAVLESVLSRQRRLNHERNDWPGLSHSFQISMLRPRSLFVPSVTFAPSIIRVLGQIGQKGKELL
jgi:hypothetical protein